MKTKTFFLGSATLLLAIAAVAAVVAEPAIEYRPTRRRLPADREAICHKFDIAGHEGYIHVGFFEDGSPGEIFIKMAKEGSTISGLMDTIATLTSLSLQYGVPLEALASKFSHVRFEPSGFTKNPDIPYAKSLTDYIFRFLGNRFLSNEQKYQAGLGEIQEQKELTPINGGVVQQPLTVNASSSAPALMHDSGRGSHSGEKATHPAHTLSNSATWQSQADAPSCADCGAIMIRNGSCYKCLNCGATSGCS